MVRRSLFLWYKKPPRLGLDAVTIPGSKSIANRALILAALADGMTTLHNLPICADVQHMLQCLGQLGIRIEQAEDALDASCAKSCARTSWRVYGDKDLGETPAASLRLQCGDAGTVARFLTTLLAYRQRHRKEEERVQLTGSAQLSNRPMDPLLACLKSAGADLRTPIRENHLPLSIGNGFKGGRFTLEGHISSQFASSLLLVAPLLEQPVSVCVLPPVVSFSYLSMTEQIMHRFGVKPLVSHAVEGGCYYSFSPQQRYRSLGHYVIESDVASASYFLAVAAILGQPLKCVGLDAASVLQGEWGFVDALEAMGVQCVAEADGIRVKQRLAPLKGIEIDVQAFPDSAITLAVLALFATGKTTLHGLTTWPHKESDRLTVVKRLLERVGARVHAIGDSLHIEPPFELRPLQVDPQGDHRIAMAFSLVSLGNVPVSIVDSDCVSKSFPGFFEQWRSLLTV